MTLSIPPDLKKRMAKYPQVKWSQVARTAIKHQLDEWEKTNQLASKSKLTEKDIKALSEKVDKEMLKHFEELINETRS